MKVGVKDKTAKATVGEMHGGSGEVGFIAEMLTDPAKLEQLVPVAGIGDKARIIAETMNDEHPEYPVVRVEEGWSNSARLWTGERLQSIAEQTNALEPVGHLGHIPDDQAAFAFPEPQTTWLGAITKKEPSKLKERLGEMVTVFYVGGYNHPGAKVRGHIKTRSVRGISWWGNGILKPIPGKGVEVTAFTLKALDWARKLAEGMPTSSIVTVTGEMEGEVDKELSQVTPDEFEKENPNGYQLIVTKAQSESLVKIGEMEVKVKEGEDAKSLLEKACEAIGIDDPAKLLEAIREATSKIGDRARASRDTVLAKILEEKVPDAEKRKIVAGLIPHAVMGEMESKVSNAKDEAEAEKIVSEMTDKAFNDTETIQIIMGEMAPAGVRRREDLRGVDGGTGKANPYIETRERVTMS